MISKLMTAAVVVLAMRAPALAADKENLQTFRDVQKQVLQYPHFTIFDSVNMQVDKGVVTLTGRVTMPYKKSDIEKRVASVPRVTRVIDQLEVLPVSSFDDQLRFRIARAIYSNPTLSMYGSMVNPPIHVIVENGKVTLEGVVNSNVDKMVARSIASSFLVFSVKNDLKTEAEVKEEMEKL